MTFTALRSTTRSLCSQIKRRNTHIQQCHWKKNTVTCKLQCHWAKHSPKKSTLPKKNTETSLECPATNTVCFYAHKFRATYVCVITKIQDHRKRWTVFETYLLEQYVFPQTETFEQETVSRVIFMQDRAPPHFSCFVTVVLNERFTDAWIRRGGPMPWPPRSPDFSLLEFFSCGGTLRTLCMLRR